MSEFAARFPRLRGLVPLLAALAGVVALAVATAQVARHGHASTPARVHAPARRLPLPVGEGPAPAAPAAPARLEPRLPTGVLDAGAAHAFGRSFFVASRAGVLASARRVAGWRRLVLRAVEGSTFAADDLSAIVYVESTGVAGAVAGPRAGITQLTPAVARHAGLKVNVRRSRRLTREIRWWVEHGNYRQARRLARRRAHVDRRFDALAELRATVRYLERAKRSLHRTDLAIASLRLGIGGLRGTVSRFGGRNVSYAQLFFGSDPHRRPVVYRRLQARGSLGSDYYWRVLAARRVLRLYRRAPARLLWEDRQQHRKSSAEEVLHPRSAGLEFGGPAELRRAWRRHVLVRLPRDPRRSHVAVDPLGGMARAIGSRRALYRGLRPGAAGVLRLIGGRVHALSGAGSPLHVTSAVRDDRYQAALRGVNPFAARTYSLHTTGFTFDISRSRLTRRQRSALRWVLDRLTAADAVAYIEEPYCFHVTVSSRAVHELGTLRRAT